MFRAVSATLLLACLVLPDPVWAANNWANAFGGTGLEAAWAMDTTADGGSVVAGQTQSFGADAQDGWVVRLSATGEMLWQRMYCGSNSDSIAAIEQTSDWGYIAAGKTASLGQGSYDGWVLKLDPQGSVQWQETYGGSGSDSFADIQGTPDGGFIAAGGTSSFGVTGGDLWVVKLDPFGSVQWQKRYGGTGSDLATSVAPTRDGGYIVAGTTASFGAGSTDGWVLKLKGDGMVDWQKTYGGAKADEFRQVLQTADGGYILAGNTDFHNTGIAYAWVVKLKSTGAIDWQKYYGGELGGNSQRVASLRSIRQLNDGRYVAIGRTYMAANLDGRAADLLLLKLSPSGEILWQKGFGGESEDNGSAVRQTNDGALLVAGNTSSFDVGSGDFWVLRLPATGSSSLDQPTNLTAEFVPSTSVIAVNSTITPQSTSSGHQNAILTPDEPDEAGVTPSLP